MSPFVPLKAESHNYGRRILISGPPNSGKTRSLHTWPKDEHIVSYPGEKGYDTIDLKMEGVHAYRWEFDDPLKTTASAVIRDVETATWEILAGKKGPLVTFAGDGLHKLYGWYYLRARADLDAASIPDDVKDARAYGYAHDDFTLYLTKVNQSKCPYVVFTVWDGKEADKEGSKSSHIWPDLPGKMAKRIMGEFPVAVNAQIDGVPGGVQTYVWQLQPGAFVWGAGVKLPERLAKKLPPKVPQDFSKLEPLLQDKG